MLANLEKSAMQTHRFRKRMHNARHLVYKLRRGVFDWSPEDDMQLTTASSHPFRLWIVATTAQ